MWYILNVLFIMNLYVYFGSFPFGGLWKNKWKLHVSIVFIHDLSENQLHFLEKWVMKKLWAFEVIYFLCVKKRNFVFSYSSMSYFDCLKGFRLCIVLTRRRNIYFIRNISSSFVICIVEWHYGVIYTYKTLVVLIVCLLFESWILNGYSNL